MYIVLNDRVTPRNLVRVAMAGIVRLERTSEVLELSPYDFN